ncbi:IclR family transcriptional regulator [Streptomyces sp. NPDC053560]|uniref:IclR family transcriptional regulator n=1 Tax=Streptomyces sp. NPDC053560 TaxID=3365711 RepID=UPI0037D3401A
MRPTLAQLLRETGESVVLNVPNGSGYRCAAAVDGTGPIRYTAIVGALIPGHAGASRHAIFAHYPEAEIRQIFGTTPLQRFNDNTITGFDALLDCDAEARRTGHSTSHGQYDEAVAAIAAPVFQAGTVAASLTVIGPAHRITRATDRIVDLVVGAAETADLVRGLRPWITQAHAHDGVRADAAVLDRLLATADGRLRASAPTAGRALPIPRSAPFRSGPAGRGVGRGAGGGP